MQGVPLLLVLLVVDGPLLLVLVLALRRRRVECQCVLQLPLLVLSEEDYSLISPTFSLFFFLFYLSCAPFISFFSFLLSFLIA